MRVIWPLPWGMKNKDTETTPVPDKKDTVKIGVEMGEPVYALLEGKANTKGITVPILIRRAIALYIILLGESARGNEIVIVKDKKALKRINLP